MIRIAAKRGVEVVQGIGEKLPFRDNAFDYIVIIVTLCFAEDPLTLLLEARRVLKTRGVIATCIIPRDSIWGQHYIAKARQGSTFYSIARFYSIEEIANMLRMMGYELLDAVSVLRYTPYEEPRLEEPEKGAKGGFVCLKARKP